MRERLPNSPSSETPGANRAYSPPGHPTHPTLKNAIYTTRSNRTPQAFQTYDQFRPRINPVIAPPDESIKKPAPKSELTYIEQVAIAHHISLDNSPNGPAQSNGTKVALKTQIAHATQIKEARDIAGVYDTNILIKLIPNYRDLCNPDKIPLLLKRMKRLATTIDHVMGLTDLSESDVINLLTSNPILLSNGNLKKERLNQLMKNNHQ